ncbi:hypothetical protein BT96DRAFT_974908 [Gymnopus androsaceus JB14]|uniref:Apple domain-containing protein n=1 Tax=Gymnopus androsaceus JB14 TaxID=1447944 RepID=A0A6A4HV38_9AGAR|nr:hypothetical protein BT96DRAFT_974908 [Gymnopus androsaceus JB14]
MNTVMAVVINLVAQVYACEAMPNDQVRQVNLVDQVNFQFTSQRSLKRLVKQRINSKYPNFSFIGEDPLTANMCGSYWVLSQNGGPSLKLPLTSSPKSFAGLDHAQAAVEWGNDRSVDLLTKRSTSFHKLADDPRNGVDGLCAELCNGFSGCTCYILGGRMLALGCQGGINIDQYKMCAKSGLRHEHRTKE